MFDLFSTREIAFIFWVMAGVAAMMFGKNLRISMLAVVESIFATKIFLVALLLLFYVIVTVWVLWKFGLWETACVKDTVFWLFSFAMVTFFSINKADDNNYFKTLIKDCFKWTVFIEFVVNFYTFSLAIELIMFPILVFVVLIQAFSQTDKKYQPVTKLSTSILALIGTFYFLYALYKTIVEYNTLFAIQNLQALLLPVILTITSLPFFYGLALFMQYETVFIRIRFMTNDMAKKKELRQAIFSVARFNLTRLKVIEKRLNKFDVYNSEDIKTYIRQLG
jgi:hypothetical protein